MKQSRGSADVFGWTDQRCWSEPSGRDARRSAHVRNGGAESLRHHSKASSVQPRQPVTEQHVATPEACVSTRRRRRLKRAVPRA